MHELTRYVLFWIICVFVLYCKFTVWQVRASPKQSAVSRDDEHKLEKRWTSTSLSGIVYSLFLAQFRSVVKCSVCREEISNVEPFLFVPLPLPDASFSMSVTVVRSHPHHSVAKTSVNVSCAGTIGDLRTAVAAASDISAEQACCLVCTHLLRIYSFISHCRTTVCIYCETYKRSVNRNTLYHLSAACVMM